MQCLQRLQRLQCLQCLQRRCGARDCSGVGEELPVCGTRHSHSVVMAVYRREPISQGKSGGAAGTDPSRWLVHMSIPNGLVPPPASTASHWNKTAPNPTTRIKAGSTHMEKLRYTK